MLFPPTTQKPKKNNEKKSLMFFNKFTTPVAVIVWKWCKKHKDINPPTKAEAKAVLSGSETNLRLVRWCRWGGSETYEGLEDDFPIYVYIYTIPKN